MVDTVQIRIGKRVKNLREKSKMKQKDVAQALNISVSAYAKLEAGDRGISSENCIALADLFGVSCDYILRGIESEYLDICLETGLSQAALEALRQRKLHAEERYVEVYKKSLETPDNYDQYEGFRDTHFTCASIAGEEYILNSLIKNVSFSDAIKRACIRISDATEGYIWNSQHCKGALVERLHEDYLGVLDAAKYTVWHAFDEFFNSIPSNAEFISDITQLPSEYIQAAIERGLLHE